MDNENKYEGVARFVWLVSGLMAIGVGLLKGLGWGLVTLALALFVVSTSVIGVIHLSERGKK